MLAYFRAVYNKGGKQLIPCVGNYLHKEWSHFRLEYDTESQMWICINFDPADRLNTPPGKWPKTDIFAEALTPSLAVYRAALLWAMRKIDEHAKV